MKHLTFIIGVVCLVTLGVEAKANSLTDIPLLYPKLPWTESAQPHYSGKANVISYNNANVEKNLGKRIFGDAKLKGKEWVAEKKDFANFEGSDALEKDFREYYEAELKKKRGWSEEVDAKGFTIQALFADGGGGSVWGYVKIQDGQFRMILFNRQQTSKDSCPCGHEFRIFLSDVVPLDKILPRLDKKIR